MSEFGRLLPRSSQPDRTAVSRCAAGCPTHCDANAAPGGHLTGAFFDLRQIQPLTILDKSSEVAEAVRSPAWHNLRLPVSETRESTHGKSFTMNSRIAVPKPSTAAKAAFAFAAFALAPSAYASFLPPEMMDTAAMGLAWFVIVFVPIGAIVLFWLVHVLPEKIAHKRHHPQRDAIHTLCLLSLAFGGLAVADRLALGLHEAGRLPRRLRNRKARRLLPGARREGAGG